MKYTLRDLIDMEHFQNLQDRLNEIYSFPSAIIDNEGNILTATAWQDICTKFHRKNKECEQDCIKSDQYIQSHLHEANPAVSYLCPRGLVDNATPIIIDGIHYGNFFTGQFFLEKPDIGFFKAQAIKYGFDEDAYLEAVKRVPIWTQEQMNSYLFFIKGLIAVISESGLKKLKEIEARKEIEESEEQHRTILQTAMDGFLVVDIQGCLLEVNEAYCRMSGYNAKELMAMRIPDIEAVEPEDNTAAHIQKVIAQGEGCFESRHRRKDGTIFEVEVSVQYRPTNGGQLVAFLRDITERKRVEEALRGSEEKYRLLVENANEALYVLQDGGFRYANRICSEMLGVPLAELIGVSMLEFLNPDDREKAIGQHLCILRGELAEGRSDFRVLTRHGEQRWADVNSVRIEWDGKPATLNFATDITDRKLVEEALTKSEEKFRKAFYTSPDAVNINRLEDGMYVSINPGFTKITGYVEEEIVGKTSIQYNIWANIEDRQRLVVGLRKDGGVANLEAAFRMKDGDLRYGLMSASMIDLNGVPHILSITRDITDRKQAERRLQDTLDSLRKAVSTTIQVMVSAVETRDPYTSGHQLRSSDLARAMATEMGLPQEKIDGIRMAGSVHDIGKLSIPAEILSKPTKLSELEFSLIKEHARKGYEMLKNVESPWPLAEMVYQHHERMNGSGYPRNLKGDDILIEARILAVADVVEAMASHRPYRPGLGIDAALEEIEKNSGIYYDKTVTDACLRLFRNKDFKLEGS